MRNTPLEVVQSGTEPKHRIAGLDSIRFLCAMLVVFDHMGILNFTRPHGLRGVGKLLWTLQDHVMNGPAAVMVFFLISGFCIHFPYRTRGRRINLPSYYSRRLLRIALPAIAAVLIRRYLVRDMSPLMQTALWSVLCEAIYYLLYPMLRELSAQVRWAWMAGGMLVVSFVISLGYMWLHPQAQNGYAESGLVLTALIGLPCWLMGCWLAEHETTFRAPSTAWMWGWRVGVFAVTVVLRVVKFHLTGPFASNAFTLNVFALLALAWLGREIAYRKVHPAVARLEWAGRWSYSLYLVHELMYPALVAMGLGTLAARNVVTHGAVIVLALLVAYGFFLLVEFPSHMLAMRVSSRFKVPVRLEPTMMEADRAA